METIRFMKTFEVEAPIFDKEGNRTGETETRTKALFVRERGSKRLGNLVKEKTFGSLWLERGSTQEEIDKMLNTEEDYSEDLEFVDKNDEGFYKAVIRE